MPRLGALFPSRAKAVAGRVIWSNRETVLKMRWLPLPPECKRAAPVTKPELGTLLPVIGTIMEAKRTGLVKLRHTAKLIFERLRDEHDFAGGYTVGIDYVSVDRAHGRETFVLDAQPPVAAVRSAHARSPMCLRARWRRRSAYSPRGLGVP